MPGAIVSERTVIGSKSVVPADTYLAPNTVATGCVNGKPTLLRSDTRQSAEEQKQISDAMDRLNNTACFTAFNCFMILWTFSTAAVAEIVTVLPLTVFYWNDSLVKYHPQGTGTFQLDVIHPKAEFAETTSHSQFTLGFALQFAAVSWLLDVWSILFFALVKWSIMGRIVGGNHIIFSFCHVRWLCMLRLKDQIHHILEYTRGTVFHIVIFQLLGAKVGKNTVLLDVMQPDWDLYEIGEDSVDFGEYACHTFENMVLKLAPVRVGNRCTIQDGSILMPGSTMEDDAVLMPASNVLKGEVVACGQCWAGNPAGLVSS